MLGKIKFDSVESKLTRENTIAFWEFMKRKYGTKTYDKSRSRLMKMIGRILVTQGIPYDRFMKDFSTAIGKGIYLNYIIGSNQKSFLGQIQNCMHEHRHVKQDQKERAYKYIYIRRPQGRVLYEGRAYRSNMELAWYFTRRIWTEQDFLRRLNLYRCPKTDVILAMKYYRETVRNLQAGIITESKDAVLFFNAL